jgi:hypothetical protein
MIRRAFACTAVCFLAAFSAPALCQQAANSTKLAAVKPHRSNVRAAKCKQVQPDSVLKAEGNANYVDFQAACNKRADLRASRTALGIDAAFTKWMREERPMQYKACVNSTH